MKTNHVIVWARRLPADAEARKNLRAFIRHARRCLPPGYYSGAAAPVRICPGWWSGYSVGREPALELLSDPSATGWVVEVVVRPDAFVLVRRRLATLPPQDRWLYALTVLIPSGARLDDPAVVAAIEASHDPDYYRGKLAREAVRWGARLDDASVVDAIARSNAPAYWRGECAAEAVRRGASLGDPAVMDALAASDDPARCYGACAVAAISRGASLGDPAVVDAIARSNAPAYWRAKCEARPTTCAKEDR